MLQNIFNRIAFTTFFFTFKCISKTITQYFFLKFILPANNSLVDFLITENHREIAFFNRREMKRSTKRRIPAVLGNRVAFIEITLQCSEHEARNKGRRGGEKAERGNLKNRNWSPSGLTRIPTRHIHRSIFKINLGPNCDRSVRKNLHISSGDQMLDYSTSVRTREIIKMIFLQRLGKVCAGIVEGWCSENLFSYLLGRVGFVSSENKLNY